MKSILHLKDDTEYQIPLREDDRAKVGTNKENGAEVGATTTNPVVDAKKETKAGKAANGEKIDDKKKAATTQSQDGPTAKKETDEITPEEVTNEEGVNNENDSALEAAEKDPDETQNQKQSNIESNNDTTTESVPPADTAKAALDEMKKLASQEGVIHPSLFISNFSKILGLMERAMQLQVKESGSATKESGSVTKEEAPKATEQAETTEQVETSAKDK